MTDKEKKFLEDQYYYDPDAIMELFRKEFQKYLNKKAEGAFCVVCGLKRNGDYAWFRITSLQKEKYDIHLEIYVNIRGDRDIVKEWKSGSKSLFKAAIDCDSKIKRAIKKIKKTVEAAKETEEPER